MAPEAPHRWDAEKKRLEALKEAGIIDDGNDPTIDVGPARESKSYTPEELETLFPPPTA